VFRVEREIMLPNRIGRNEAHEWAVNRHPDELLEDMGRGMGTSTGGAGPSGGGSAFGRGGGIMSLRRPWDDHPPGDTKLISVGRLDEAHTMSLTVGILP
jgi:hypothetical protein